MEYFVDSGGCLEPSSELIVKINGRRFKKGSFAFDQLSSASVLHGVVSIALHRTNTCFSVNRAMQQNCSDDYQAIC